MKLLGLHHFAWKCANAEETIKFYTTILDLPHVNTIEKEFVPSTGEYAPYKHVFFELADGSCIAFFDIGDNKGVKVDCEDWIVHFAFEVESREEVDAWYQRLVDKNIEVVGPTNHDDWIYSIYFFDPYNLRLEITTRLGPPEVTKHIGIIGTEFKNILSSLE